MGQIHTPPHSLGQTTHRPDFPPSAPFCPMLPFHHHHETPRRKFSQLRASGLPAQWHGFPCGTPCPGPVAASAAQMCLTGTFVIMLWDALAQEDCALNQLLHIYAKAPFCRSTQVGHVKSVWAAWWNSSCINTAECEDGSKWRSPNDGYHLQGNWDKWGSFHPNRNWMLD